MAADNEDSLLFLIPFRYAWKYGITIFLISCLHKAWFNVVFVVTRVNQELDILQNIVFLVSSVFFKSLGDVAS